MSLKQNTTQCYAYIPENHYIPGALPFRSRNSPPFKPPVHVHLQDMSSQLDHQTTHEGLPLPFVMSQQTSSKSERFDSSSPTSVIQQARSDIYPPTPSPICSPSPSSANSPPHSVSATSTISSELLRKGSQNDSARTYSSKIEKKAIKSSGGGSGPSETPRDSLSPSTEGRLLALLASKLFPYKESRFLQHSGERSEASIHDKHITVDDRGSKPPVEETLCDENPQDSMIARHHVHRRIPSETPSEASLGSANERTLSMEFDAVLAAAVAAGIGQATSTRNTDEDTDVAGPSEIRVQLPDNEEDRGVFRGDYEHRDNVDTTYALVPVSMASDVIQEGTSSALTLVGQATAIGGRSSNRGSNADFENKMVSHSSQNSNRRSGNETNGEIFPRCINEAEIGAGREDRENEPFGGSGLRLSPESFDDSSPDLSLSTSERLAEATGSNSRFPSSDYTNGRISPSDSFHLALQKVRREKTIAKALAFEQAENARHENRYRTEERKIQAWENQQRIKASISMKKVEMKLEEKRARAYEKMQNEISLAHKKAEERRATSEAKRGCKAAKVAHEVEKMKKTGKVPGKCIFF